MGDTLRGRINAMLPWMEQTEDCDYKPGHMCEGCSEQAALLLEVSDAAVNMEAAHKVLIDNRSNPRTDTVARLMVHAALGRGEE